MFLSKILIHSCIIIHYLPVENDFVVYVYKLLEQQMYLNVILKTALKLIVNNSGDAY